jgi:FHS family L-fucose permease-like MFS transporter
LAAGIILLQVASNPLIAVLGPAEKAHSRLTLAQAFNSLGTMLAPLAAAWMIFGTTGLPAHEAVAPALAANVAAVQTPFVIACGMLGLVALIFWINRDYPVPDTGKGKAANSWGFGLLARPPFLFGAIAIFAYVGAEVALGSMLVSYLMQPNVLAVTAFQASRIASLYWGGAMLGRFLGSAALRVVSPTTALAACGLGAAILTTLSLTTGGAVAAVAIIAIGLFNAIMFPTIFALTIEDLGECTPQGSGILCTAIIGGSIVPLVTGMVADRYGLPLALLVPVACYLWIAFYGAWGWKIPSKRVAD